MADSIGNIYGNALFEVCCEENCLDDGRDGTKRRPSLKM